MNRLWNFLIDIGMSEEYPKLKTIPEIFPDLSDGSIMRQTPIFWKEVARTHTAEQIEALIKTLTIAEHELPGWKAGSVSPVIWLIRTINSNIDRAYIKLWVLKNTSNDYLPDGSLIVNRAESIAALEKDIFETEHYHFYCLAIQDFEEALQIGTKLKLSDDILVRNILLKGLVIAYMRPFSSCQGILLKIDKRNKWNPINHKLPKSTLPNIVELIELHEELQDLRNKLFAHTDLRMKNPHTGPCWIMSFKAYDYEMLYARLPEILNLVNKVKGKVVEDIQFMQNSSSWHR